MESRAMQEPGRQGRAEARVVLSLGLADASTPPPQPAARPAAPSSAPSCSLPWPPVQGNPNNIAFTEQHDRYTYSALLKLPDFNLSTHCRCHLCISQSFKDFVTSQASLEEQEAQCALTAHQVRQAEHIGGQLRQRKTPRKARQRSSLKVHGASILRLTESQSHAHTVHKTLLPVAGHSSQAILVLADHCDNRSADMLRHDGLVKAIITASKSGQS